MFRGGHISSTVRTLAGLLLLVSVFLVFANVSAQESTDATRAELERRIAEIMKEIQQLDSELGGVRQQSNTLQGEIGRLDGNIKRAELTIRGLNLSIAETQSEIYEREQIIGEAEREIDEEKVVLSEYLRQFHKSADRSLIEMLLTKDLATFFREVDALEELQGSAEITLNRLYEVKAILEAERLALQDKNFEYTGLRELSVRERENLAAQKGEKADLLRVTKGEEARYQSMIANKQRDIDAIRAQIASLTRAGISAETAVEAAEIAADGAGIRTAFLLGLLEVETGRRFANGQITAGSYTGSGNWRTDMNPSQYPCFERITSRLGLNPDNVKVSAKPPYAGWGGAMGVAQFLPCTWESYQAQVSRITGHNPSNPWNLVDGFTASALYLARYGATSQTRSGEEAAARAYIGGPGCASSTCFWYAGEVLRIADLIERNL